MCLPRLIAEAGFKIEAGDIFFISHPNPSPTIRNWIAEGQIVSTKKRNCNSSQEIRGEISLGPKFKVECHIETTTGYKIEFDYNSTSFDRMRKALNKFSFSLNNDDSCMSNQIRNLILGGGGGGGDSSNVNVNANFDALKIRPEDLTAPNLPSVNSSQANAIKTAIQRSLTLIQGPPGTGKTVTSASIVYHLSQRGKVLVVASSNVAVDHLTDKINQTGLRVVRVMAKSRENLESPNSFKLLRRAERTILEGAQVICCTCIGAGDRRLSKFRFSSVLIDEATQATEPETLIALVRGAQ